MPIYLEGCIANPEDICHHTLIVTVLLWYTGGKANRSQEEHGMSGHAVHFIASQSLICFSLVPLISNYLDYENMSI